MRGLSDDFWHDCVCVLLFRASVVVYIIKLNRKTRRVITYMTDKLTHHCRMQFFYDCVATLVRPVRSNTTEVNTDRIWLLKAK